MRRQRPPPPRREAGGDQQPGRDRPTPRATLQRVDQKGRVHPGHVTAWAASCRQLRVESVRRRMPPTEPTPLMLEPTRRLRPGPRSGSSSVLAHGEHLAGLGRGAQLGGQVHRLADVVVALEQQGDAGGDARCGRRSVLWLEVVEQVSAGGDRRRIGSVPTSITPSPSHFATRTPRLGGDVAGDAAELAEFLDRCVRPVARG